MKSDMTFRLSINSIALAALYPHEREEYHDSSVCVTRVELKKNFGFPLKTAYLLLKRRYSLSERWVMKFELIWARWSGTTQVMRKQVNRLYTGTALMMTVKIGT